MFIRKAAFTHLGIFALLFVCFLIFSGCNYRPLRNQPSEQNISTPSVETALPVELATPETPRLLTICLGQEPASLFLYGDSSASARGIRQAIYDGPLDLLNYEPQPVILESIPSMAAGGVIFEPVTVQSGGVLVDSSGSLVSLDEGASYYPSGCSDSSCAAIYTGTEPVQVDQQVVRFKLRSGLTWADGAPLTADDSQYSFEVAKALYPQAKPELISRTHSYLALDETTVEWRGIPGYRYAGYVASFFTPLPRHAWSAFSVQDLLTVDESNRKPLGWGPYQINEWTPGDHISLSRNPNYFRSSEGLPAFETLVFRFVSSPEEAIAGLLAGECDLLDETNNLEVQQAALLEAQTAGKLVFTQQAGMAWEHLDFGIASRNSAAVPIFQTKEMRQALALCMDRQKIVDELFPGRPVAIDSYISADHPLFNPDVKRYTFDPAAGNALLESLGWRDDDGNAATPRRSSGAAGIADGTALEFTFLTTGEPVQKRIGEMLVDSLTQCGMAVMVSNLPAEQLFATGQDAPLFGRNFTLTQFGWMGAWQPPCYLYSTQEVPGPYPEFQKGWGGANLSGYSSADFDRACQRALSTMPEQPEYQSAHFLAQSIFAEDLPALPLYLHTRQIAAREGLCGVNLNPSADSILWNLEAFSQGENCTP